MSLQGSLRLAYQEIERLRKKLVVENNFGLHEEMPDLNDSSRYFGRVSINNFDALNFNKEASGSPGKEKFSTPRKNEAFGTPPEDQKVMNHFDDHSGITLELSDESQKEKPIKPVHQRMGTRNMSAQPRQQNKTAYKEANS